MEDERSRRRAARASWPIQVHPLGEEPTGDLSRSTTAEQRLDMMWTLARDAWAAGGKPIPDYPRSEAPGRVIRGGHG